MGKVKVVLDHQQILVIGSLGFIVANLVMRLLRKTSDYENARQVSGTL